MLFMNLNYYFRTQNNCFLFYRSFDTYKCALYIWQYRIYFPIADILMLEFSSFYTGIFYMRAVKLFRLSI